jgi:hypothetical protein
MIMNLDEPLSKTLEEQIGAIADIQSVRQLSL